MKCAKRNQSVLFILNRTLESLPVRNFDSLNPNILKKIIFHYIKSPKELMKVLLGVHTYEVKPSIILIDSLHHFFNDWYCENHDDLSKTDYLNFFENHCLIVSSLHNSIEFFSKTANKNCLSVISLNFSYDKLAHFYEKMKEKLIDFYFYEPRSVLNHENWELIINDTLFSSNE